MTGNSKHALPGSDNVTRVVLDNGIIILARENFTSPSVVVDGLAWGGSIFESREKAGLASFTTSMLTHGTSGHTFQEFYDVVESNGASLEIGSGNHTISFGSKSLAEDLSLMLGLTAESLREPTFPEEYIEKVRGQIITGLHYREQSTRSMSSLHFKELVYPAEHPYSRSGSGYLDTVPSLNRDDMLDFHRQIGPEGTIIVIIGAVKTEQAVEQVRAIFEDWSNPNQPAPPRVAAPVARPPEVAQRFVPIPGKSQADIVFGYPGPARNAPDYQAARMANNILGRFGMYGRLGDNIREDQGLAYYSYSTLTGGLGPGPWQVSAGVAPENVEKTIESIRREIRRMTDEPVTDDELADNKSYFKGHLVLGLETNDGVSSTLLNMELYELGLDYLQKYASMIDAITVEDVQRASQQYLDADAYVVAVAGPPGK